MTAKKKAAIKNTEKPAKKLTDKQQVFILEYCQCFNASEAARRAGYSVKSAYGAGYLLLRNREVRVAIDAKMQEKAMAADEVLARLSEQARGSQFHFIRVNDDGQIEWDFSDPEAKDHMHLIKTIRTKRKHVFVGKGEEGTDWEHEWVEVELYSAQTALEILAKHHKLLTERLDVNTTLHVDGLEDILEKVYGDK
jgi:phage terminase small subunit